MSRRFEALVMAMALAWLVAGLTQPSIAAGAPTLRLGTSVGPPTTATKVAGRGFGASEVVDISFDAEVLSTVATRPNGGFRRTVAIPSSATPGQHVISAAGESSGSSASVDSTVRTDWVGFQFDLGNTGANPYENVLSASNVSGLEEVWSAFTARPRASRRSSAASPMWRRGAA